MFVASSAIRILQYIGQLVTGITSQGKGQYAKWPTQPFCFIVLISLTDKRWHFIDSGSKKMNIQQELLSLATNQIPPV